MKPKRKLIFDLSKFEGLTYSEIAAHFSISERAVEDNIAKALEHIWILLNPIKNDLYSRWLCEYYNIIRLTTTSIKINFARSK